ncbi:regulator of G-protein signaling 10-like isoform X2 [Narcine bancroftii]|uniref:regulator of G-protein signaling 10-like isoform X2 n=1 Tax=Narcine bancroftii TaxID=1343680 RepID=UPI00383164B1
MFVSKAVSRLSRKRPPSEIHDNDVHAGCSQPSTSGISKWAISLEHLLEDPEGVKLFRDFLRREFSEENVLFWLACEEFKKIQDENLLRGKAQQIYKTFLCNKAATQVNVEGQSRLTESMLAQPHPFMFQKLQEQIFTLMKYDSYNRFLKSDLCQQVKQQEERAKNSQEVDESVPKRASRIYNR